jgi:hypothetical protein
MRHSKLLFFVAMMAALPSFAQQSASYQIRARVQNNGGAPKDGAIPASTSYKAGAGSSGEDAVSGLLSSASFHAELGFIAAIQQVAAPPPACTYFCDDFEDNDDSNWTFIGKGTWDPTNPDLIATTAKKALAVSPAFTAPTVRTVEANLKIGTAGARVSVFGWYTDKSHSVELRLMPDKRKVLLKQAAGVLHAKRKFLTALNVGQSYNVKVTYDGTRFQVFFDGGPNAVITMNAAAVPGGNAAFEVKSSTKLPETGSMADIAIN